jgi:hypothetical protein
MGQARPDLIRHYWENPPGPSQGITLIRMSRGREYETTIGPRGSLTQIETAAVLGVSVMTVNRYVRAGVLKGHTEDGVSVIRLSEIKRFLKARDRAD